MSLRRTTVFAEENDLAIIKAAATRRGVPEAELIREAIHLAAMANRTWDDPFFSKTFVPGDRATERAIDAAKHVWADEADAYEQTKNSAH